MLLELGSSARAVLGESLDGELVSLLVGGVGVSDPQAQAIGQLI